MNEKQLVAILDMLTEGRDAAVPKEMKLEAVVLQGFALPWMKAKGVQGFGISEKITAGRILPDVTLKVYVEKKLPLTECAHPVPKKIKTFMGTVFTDVEEIGKVRLEPNMARVRPAIPGYGVSHLNVTVGTLGCLVRKKGERDLYILSNSHVIANEGVCNVGDPIVQPGVYDGGVAPQDIIANLSDWIPFKFSTTGFINLVDAAIAKVKSAKLVTAAIKDIGIPVGVSSRLARGMRIQKTGRTTDHTTGIIKDINYRLALKYKKPGGGQGRVGLKDQVLCTRYSAGGDSGSAVCNMQKKVVGLHFAGSPSTSIFNKIKHVLNLLDVEIVSSEQGNIPPTGKKFKAFWPGPLQPAFQPVGKYLQTSRYRMLPDGNIELFNWREDNGLFAWTAASTPNDVETKNLRARIMSYTKKYNAPDIFWLQLTQ